MKFHPQARSIVGASSEKMVSQYPSLQVCRLPEKADLPAEKCIVVSDSFEPMNLVEVFVDSNLRHLVQSQKDRFEESLDQVGRLIEGGSQYFSSDYQIFSEPSLDQLGLGFSGREDKEQLKLKTSEFLSGLNSEIVSGSADSIIEELYMNAVIDAPREAGKMLVPLESRSAELYLARSQDWLQISCTDSYGSLDVAFFLSRLHTVYELGVDSALQASSEVNGAGLGCMILFEQCTRLILGVQPDLKTKVTCMIPLGISNRERVLMKKSLHWFEI